MYTGNKVGFIDSALGSDNFGDGAVLTVRQGTAMSEAGSDAFVLDTAYLLWSILDLNRFGVVVNTTTGKIDPVFATSNPVLYEYVRRFYERLGENRPLWIVAHDWMVEDTTTSKPYTLPDIVGLVNSTTLEGDIYHPVMVDISVDGVKEEFVTAIVPATGAVAGTIPELDVIMTWLNTQLQGAMDNNYRASGLLDVLPILVANADDDVKALTVALLSVLPTTAVKDLSAYAMGDIAGILSEYLGADGEYASVNADVAAKKLSIGYENSIGNYAVYGQDFNDAYIPVYNITTKKITRISVRALLAASHHNLGDKQYVYLRKRPQVSGVYYNDEATCNDKNMGLSSLQASITKNKSLDTLEDTYARTTEEGLPYGADGHLSAGTKSDLASRGEDALNNNVRGLVRVSVRDVNGDPAIYEGAPNYVSSLHYDVKAKIAILRKNKTQEVELTYTV